MTSAILVAAGYLAGSMPFGYWLVRLAKGVDIRTVGSGSIGASNVWRTFGRGYGIPIVLLDTAKGFAPALVASLVANDLVGVLAGGAAMLGHWRPLFLRFERGGKMVATCGGAFLALAPLVGVIGGLVWLAVFLGLRYPSVASMVGATSLPIVAAGMGESWPVIAFGGIAALAVIVLHRGNIARLRAGTENRARLGRRKGAAVQA